MNVRFSVAAIAIGLSLMGCARTVYVQDNQKRPVEGAKVTLTNEHGSTSALTGHDGYAHVPRAASETPAKLVIEKEGYETKHLNYPGKISIIDILEPAKTGG